MNISKKLKFEMTPDRRLDLSFWLGIFQAAFWYLALSDMNGAVGAVHWGYPAVAWFVILYFYIMNSRNFKKETLWMAIKNPDKVGSDGWVKLPGSPPPSSRPPPPPMPPTKPPTRSLGGGR